MAAIILAEISGLEIGDVIIKAETDEVNNLTDLLQAHQSHNWMGRLNIVVFRNQSETKLLIKTK